MYFLWLAAALICFAYYILCASYAGIGSSFIFIWLIGGIFFSVVFGVRFAHVRGIISVSHKISTAFAAVMIIGVILFVILECLVISGMTENTDEDCRYVIVLGCQIRGDRITRSLRKRLDKAYYYGKKHEDAVIIVSGGKGDGENTTEAEAMFNYLVEKGISPERIIQEDKSYNTDQNMRYSAKLMDDTTAKTAIVTSNFHVYRAKKLAAAKGITNTYGIAAGSDKVLITNYMVREAIGILKDFICHNF